MPADLLFRIGAADVHFEALNPVRPVTASGQKQAHSDARYRVVQRSENSAADAGKHWKKMKFKCIEFSWRATFIGVYLTPERDRLWVSIIPFFPLYFKRR